MQFEDFEKCVMKFVLREQTEQSILLSKQYDVATVVSREFTGCGFFTNFRVPNLVSALPNSVNIELGCLGELEGVQYGIGFVLFVRQGLISMLEGYVYNEKWPKSIGQFNLFDPRTRNPSFDEMRLIHLLIHNVRNLIIPHDLDAKIKVADMDDSGMRGLKLFPEGSVTSDGCFKKHSSACKFLDQDGVEVTASLYLDKNGKLCELAVRKSNFKKLIHIPENSNIRIIT
ncbi:MAG: hypothetical protein FWH21_00705 [Kiritimatiellaeota bacterium]|nr:hypothetical protein [Kiritimatiellota bacterium]